MKHEQIDSSARVWVVTLGADGRLEEQLDPDLLAQIAEAKTDEDITRAVADKIARTRDW
jgi:hypothetical protein